MKQFEVDVTAWGRARITANTKKEAVQRARDGKFDPATIRHVPWSARVSTVREVPKDA